MRKLLGALGVFLFLSALLLGLYLVLVNWLAVAQDSRETVHGIADPPPCDWDVAPPERVMSEESTQTMVIQAANPLDGPCESVISLRAPVLH